jgi:hypothetical protein
VASGAATHNDGLLWDILEPKPFSWDDRLSDRKSPIARWSDFMSLIRTFYLRLKGVFRKNQMENDLAEELQFHLQAEIEKNVAAGMAPDEARYAALRTLVAWSKSQKSAAMCEASGSSKSSGRT